MKRSIFLLTVVFLIVVSGIASAQQTDVSVNVSGVFTNQNNGSFLDRTATTSAGFLFSFRHFPYRNNGVEVSYGYTKNSQEYKDRFGNDIPPIQTSVHELTADYVLRANLGQFHPFALAGGGLLIFDPTSNAVDTAIIPISRQTRVAFLYGAGVDVQLAKALALRAQYRGLFYEAPDFGSSDIHTGSAMHTMEPTIGIVYKF
jgi:opacity protein-like surface antigen